jgi:hypothetical protein
MGHAAAVATSGGFVYYTDPLAGQVMRVPTDGSALPSIVATGYANTRAVAALGATVIFSSPGNSGQVLSVAASGPPAVPTPLATSQGNPFSVALDGTTAYWSNTSAVGGAASSGSIMKKTAAGVPAALASGQPIPTCIAVDGTSVYWMNAFGASVMRVAK